MPKIKINESAFASQIKQYFDTRQFNADRLDSTLRTCTPKCDIESRFRLHHACNALSFDYTGELLLLLIKKAHETLEDKTTINNYCENIAQTMQYFADGFGEDTDAGLSYPHFLMHGIASKKLENVINKIKNNARIIHETRANREHFINSIKLPLNVDYGLKIDFGNGQSDDFFGTCCFMYDKTISDWSSGCFGYVAKFSIFLDITNKTIYGLTLQGKESEKTKMPDRTMIKDKEKGKYWFRLTSKLQMDPRAYLIKKVMKLTESKGYQQIKIIKPQYHPMFIEQHKGFIGKYEQAILRAGVTKDTGIYLEQIIKSEDLLIN